jgi:hypothetical protein
MRKYIVYVESCALKLRIDWASLLVSTGLDVATGLQVLQNLCKQKTHVEIPRGTSCYHLGNALYRSLGRIKEGLQAYNAAWQYHEIDRTRTLIASRQAASRQNIIAMERSSRIRIQVMTELPHILINRGQAQVANGTRKKPVVYDTCWLYSLCNFQCRPTYKSTCLNSFGRRIFCEHFF